MKAILSFAHEWVQKLPLKDNVLVCVRCKTETVIGDWNISTCDPHLESIDSGYSGKIVEV